MIEDNSLDNLQFIQIKIWQGVKVIPSYIIEAVKGRTYTVDQFYDYQERQIKFNNKNNFLFVLIDNNKKVHGYLWCETNSLDGSLFVNTFSIAKEYWHKGKAIPKVIEFLKKLKVELGSTRVFWLTTNEKFFTRYGFKRSKNALLEYNAD